MKQYNVLVVDDSAFMRKSITLILEKDPCFSVIGIARNGQEAVEKVERLRPDLVTMDVEMPVMNGLQALEQIMKRTPIPVVMLSSLTREGASETLKALELGAVDFFLKGSLLNNQEGVDESQEFLGRLKGIAASKLTFTFPKFQTNTSYEVKEVDNSKKDCIIIGCSTGGPSALQSILPHFPKDFPIPIFVAQHMPPGFTKPLAERFDTLCQLKVKEAKNGDRLQAGTIYIAPSGFQTQFEKNQDETISFSVNNEVFTKALYKPSIDITLSSAAPIFTNRLLSVILTGMGVDGMIGCGVVKKHKGSVFVESEDSCVVYGMPRAVLEAGYADRQYRLAEMFHEIISYVCD